MTVLTTENTCVWSTRVSTFLPTVREASSFALLDITVVISNYSTFCPNLKLKLQSWAFIADTHDEKTSAQLQLMNTNYGNYIANIGQAEVCSMGFATTQMTHTTLMFHEWNLELRRIVLLVMWQREFLSSILNAFFHRVPNNIDA